MSGVRGIEQGLTFASLRFPLPLRGQARRRGKMPRKKTNDPRRLHDAPRGHCVSVRVNEGELSRLDAERGAYKRGEWMRRSWLKIQPKQAAPELNREAWAALARVSSNLNQLAYHANASGDLSSENTSKLVHVLQDMRQRVEQLRADLLGIVPVPEED